MAVPSPVGDVKIVSPIGTFVLNIKCIYLFTYFVSCLFTLDAPSHLHKNPEAGLFFPFDRSFVEL